MQTIRYENIEISLTAEFDDEMLIHFDDYDDEDLEEDEV